jgi:hypothetical protein
VWATLMLVAVISNIARGLQAPASVKGCIGTI